MANLKEIKGRRSLQIHAKLASDIMKNSADCKAVILNNLGVDSTGLSSEEIFCAVAYAIDVMLAEDVEILIASLGDVVVTSNQYNHISTSFITPILLI